MIGKCKRKPKEAEYLQYVGSNIEEVKKFVGERLISETEIDWSPAPALRIECDNIPIHYGYLCIGGYLVKDPIIGLMCLTEENFDEIFYKIE